MRKLRFAAPGADVDHVVLETADGGEQFVLRIDPPLRDSIRADLPRLHHGAPRDEPTITPREIQVRVRAGEPPDALAEEHSVGLDWVLRFAGPVLEERDRMAGEARRARARRSTTEGQTVVFGEAVDERFAAHGIDPSHVHWDARRREDGQWIIAAHWLGGDAERVAEWSFHLTSRTVTPTDDTAADLLSDRPIRPITPLVEVEPVTAVSLTLAPPLLPGVVAFPALAGLPDAHTGPLPVPEEVFDQDALDNDAAGAPELPDPAAVDAPPLPLQLADIDDGPDAATLPLPSIEKLGAVHRASRSSHGSRATRDDDETEEQKAARAHIPSWDDILLGVRRKSD